MPIKKKFRGPMKITKVSGNKKEYLDLLLLADEQENMVDRYLERGEMFVLDDDGIKAECVVTKESDDRYELKNIAVRLEDQRKGYGRAMIEYLFSYYPTCRVLFVGTGDGVGTVDFYISCGFTKSHYVRNFFVDYYDHPIYEDGKRLTDMIYLKRER